MIEPEAGNRAGMTQESRVPPNEDPTVSTPPGEDTPYTAAGDAEPGVEPGPDVAEEFAESVPIDPTPDQVEQYLELAGAPEALAPETADTDSGDSGDTDGDRAV
jgi:hypothetical protein